MQTYQGTEVGGWVERYQTGTRSDDSIPQDIACKMSDVAGWPNLLYGQRDQFGDVDFQVLKRLDALARCEESARVQPCQEHACKQYVDAIGVADTP